MYRDGKLVLSIPATTLPAAVVKTPANHRNTVVRVVSLFQTPADNLATMPGFAKMNGVVVDSTGRADPQSQLFRSAAVGVDKGPMISQVWVLTASSVEACWGRPLPPSSTFCAWCEQSLPDW